MDLPFGTCCKPAFDMSLLPAGKAIKVTKVNKTEYDAIVLWALPDVLRVSFYAHKTESMITNDLILDEVLSGSVKLQLL